MAKLLKNTEAERTTGILKNATIIVPLKHLKHLSSFWRSLKILLNY